MKLTPLDIHHKEFRRTLRGYNEEQVDAFLDEVADEFERLFKENVDYKEELEQTKEKLEQYENIEQTLQNTLVTAQKSAEEVQTNARKEAELSIKDAELKAKELLQDAETEKRALKNALNKLRQTEEDFRIKLKSILESYMGMLSDIKEERDKIDKEVMEELKEKVEEVPIQAEAEAQAEAREVEEAKEVAEETEEETETEEPAKEAPGDISEDFEQPIASFMAGDNSQKLEGKPEEIDEPDSESDDK